jgi:hypothetical protein
VETKEITSSRWKTLLYLLVSSAFVAFSIFHLRTSHKDMVTTWLGLVFFGLGIPVFSWLLIRPQRLLFDAEGFTVAGGMIRTPWKIRWQDVSEFLVIQLPRGGKMVGFNYVPGARKTSALSRVARMSGADGGLPKSWPGSVEDMVDELNDYRIRATGGGRVQRTFGAAQSTGSTR